MSDCGCNKAKAELEEYLHNELTVNEAADIAEHMANCDDCSAEHLIGLTLTEKVRKACNEKAPEDLRNAILSRLAEV